MQRNTVAIIGAGVAGLACARRLHDAGIDVAIYDKGRGPGGRLSGRRTAWGRFDHGAQFFTVRNDAFARRVDAWRQAGLVARWDGAHLKDGRPFDRDDWFVGTPKMSAFVAAEADALGASFGLRLAPPRREAGRWHLFAEAGHSAWAADWVVVAAPAEQAAVLLPAAAPRLRDAARAARSAPTWTLMAAWHEAPRSFDTDQREGDLAFVSRQASRPGAEDGHRWVAHASAAWSRAHLEAEPEAVAETLGAILAGRLGADVPAFVSAHRWRYAQVERTADASFGLDAEARLATCGDWHIAPRIESAWVSGDALGEALLHRF